MKAMKPMAWVLIIATLAHADVPKTLERRKDIEAALLEHDRARAPGNVLVGAGVISMIAAAICGGYGASLAVEDTTRVAVGTALYPLTGRAPTAGHGEEINTLLGVALAAGIGGFVALMSGLVVRQVMAPAAEKRSLLLESARLEGELRAERRLSLLSDAPRVEEPSPSPIVEQPVEPPPPAPPRRVPLRPK